MPHLPSPSPPPHLYCHTPPPPHTHTATFLPHTCPASPTCHTTTLHLIPALDLHSITSRRRTQTSYPASTAHTHPRTHTYTFARTTHLTPHAHPPHTRTTTPATTLLHPAPHHTARNCPLHFLLPAHTRTHRPPAPPAHCTTFALHVPSMCLLQTPIPCYMVSVTSSTFFLCELNKFQTWWCQNSDVAWKTQQNAHCQKKRTSRPADSWAAARWRSSRNTLPAFPAFCSHATLCRHPFNNPVPCTLRCLLWGRERHTLQPMPARTTATTSSSYMPYFAHMPHTLLFLIPSFLFTSAHTVPPCTAIHTTLPVPHCTGSYTFCHSHTCLTTIFHLVLSSAPHDTCLPY